MVDDACQTIHASCVSLTGAGVVLRGPSGAGKSDLALRLIGRGALLVADDRVRIEVRGGCVVASAPARLRGLIEVRGVGILRARSVEAAPVRLVVDLTPGEAIERLPDERRAVLCGVEIPIVTLDPFHASAPAAVALTLENLPEGSTAPEQPHGLSALEA